MLQGGESLPATAAGWGTLGPVREPRGQLTVFRRRLRRQHLSPAAKMFFNHTNPPRNFP